MTTKAESVMAAARALLANPSDDLHDAVEGEGGYCLTPRGWAERRLRAALALPDAPAPAPSPWVGDCGIGSGPATHPPTDAAAAERAEIVAELRRMAGVYEAAGLRQAMEALRDAADRIAARGPGQVWTEDANK